MEMFLYPARVEMNVKARIRKGISVSANTVLYKYCTSIPFLYNRLSSFFIIVYSTKKRMWFRIIGTIPPYTSSFLVTLFLMLVSTSASNCASRYGFQFCYVVTMSKRDSTVTQITNYGSNKTAFPDYVNHRQI